MSQVSILGQREQGQDVRSQNIMGCTALANVVKSSLGPQGLDKMLVDEIGETTITNDGATILRLLEVTHPASKVLVELSQMQDREVGDGTTSVVILAAELLKRANELVKNKVHATSVIEGYRLALNQSVKFIVDRLTVKTQELTDDLIIAAAKTSMSSKLIGSESEFFSKMVVDAMKRVKMVNAQGQTKYPVQNVHILKTHGKSSKESKLCDGYAIEACRSAQGMPKFMDDAKIAFIDFNLNKFRLQMGVQVLVEDPDNLDKIRQKEMDITKVRCQKIIDSGANVVLCARGIDDFALKYFVEAGVIAVRRVKKSDLRRIAKSTGGKVVISLADIEGEEETYSAENLGTCKRVEERRVGDWDYIFFEGMTQQAACTIVVRGANEFFLDETDRSIHDSLCVVKRVLESKNLVAGGGAVEVALSIHLDEYARTLDTREQLAIAEFSEALLCIPKILALNAAKDATDLLTRLRVYHIHAQMPDADEKKKAMIYCGLDLLNGKTRNNLSAGVVEPALSKVKSLKFATEAAITILRIDDMIRLIEPKPDGGQY